VLSSGTPATMNAKQTDAAGNVSAASSNLSFSFDATAPTATYTLSLHDALPICTVVRITATFSEALADSPVVKLAISGSNTLSATAMTKTDTTHYYYDHTCRSGDDTATVAMSIGTDVAGNVITSAPTSGSTFTVD